MAYLIRKPPSKVSPNVVPSPEESNPEATAPSSSERNSWMASSRT
jgi:hypothetical protein